MPRPREVLFVVLGACTLFALWLTSTRFGALVVEAPGNVLQPESPVVSSHADAAAPNKDSEVDEDEAQPPASDLDTPEPFPTNIWQSWKDDSEDPTERTKGFPRKWRTMNPEWDYERVTDATIDEFVSSRFDGDISTTFMKLDDAILKADFLRYLILLREGGVWADIDVLPHQPIHDWIPEQYNNSVNLVIGIENDHHKKPIWPGSPYSVQLCQYTILAKPGHPAIKTLVGTVTEDLESLLASKKPGQSITFADVMGTTGPFAFTKAMMDYFTEQTGVKHTGDELDRLKKPRQIGDVLVLPKDSFGWLPQEHDHEEGDPMILVEHLFIASWRDGHPG